MQPLRIGLTVAVAWAFMQLFASRTWADGPHWEIPEPPNDENQILNGDLAQFVGRMGLSHSSRPMRGGRPGLDTEDQAQADPLRKQIVLVCVQYMREGEDEAAAPDSPNSWKTPEGRERMVRYAHRWLTVLARKPELAQVLVEAYGDQVRLDDSLRNKQLPQVQAALDAFKRAREVQSWQEELAQCQQELQQARDPKVSQALQQRIGALQGRIQASRGSGGGAVYATFHQLSNQLPPSFQGHMTGDILFTQDVAAGRLAAALRAAGPTVVGPLQSLAQQDRNPAVKEQADKLLKRIVSSPQPR